MNRRQLLILMVKWLAAVPVVAVAGALLPSVLRLFKPDAPPVPIGEPALSKAPEGAQRVGNINDPELKGEWGVVDFIFRQQSVEYSARAFNLTKVPGYVVKLPPEGRVTDQERRDGIAVYSRICPHLGCIFNIERDKQRITRAYSVPLGRLPENPVFACPCHFSTYDLARAGKVIFGPAPRPPRRFFYEIDENGEILVSGWEAGGIA